MTSAATNEQQTAAPPPAPSAEITCSRQYSVNPLAEVDFRRMCAQIPAVPCRIAWRTDRRAVRLLLGCHSYAAVIFQMLTEGPSYGALNRLSSGGGR
ncbi:hypothetical protein ACIQFZ_08745 [Streptomyces sp. NPDC093064]|uniref:hypothetical protein n=1 Tax=Streptomyces sp. NPDC093064 TaxID=3366020 RepID=UPI00380C8862